MGSARVVIVGGGFGGLIAAKALRRAPVEVTLVDRLNHHLFQPLLYQVAMAGLSPAEIAVPIRSVLRRCRNVRVLLAEATAVDLATRVVRLDGGEELPWDFLILAAGAETNYFGHDEWSRHALGLKDLDDAVEIRRRVLYAFERAEREPDEALRRQLLTFAVIGGGPTGVELAGALAELARFALGRDFRRVRPRDVRVVLLEGGPRLLAAFEPHLSDKAVEQIRELGVELRLGARVTGIEEGRVLLGGDELRASVIIWGAGVKARPLAATLGVPLDRSGRVIVGPDCAIPGHPAAFAIGDIAAFTPPGEPAALPGLAPVAMQQGRLVARNLARTLAGEERRTFAYQDKGTMATIGRSRAIAQTRRLRLSGFPAWIAWLFIHLLYLIDFRNRLLVLFDWTWSYFTYKRGARLITGHPSLPPGPGR